MEGFQYQLLKHTLESARAGAASPGAWGVAGGLHPAAPLPLQKLTPFSSLAPSAMGGFLSFLDGFYRLDHWFALQAVRVSFS